MTSSSITVAPSPPATTLTVGVWSVMVGDFPLSVRQALGAVFGDGGKDAEFIVGTLRLPRALTGMMVGAALGMSGAAAGAVVVITMFGASNTQVAVGAVAGGLLTALIVYVLAYQRGLAASRLVLVGIGIGFTASAAAVQQGPSGGPLRKPTAVVAALLLASCGSAPHHTSSTSTSRSTTPAESATGARVFVDKRGVSVNVASSERIIPLDGDVAEIVFALGMGDRVVATDLSATYPPEADALPQIGNQRALNAEPILGLDPTLVIATDIAGPPEVIEELERVGVPGAIVPTPADATGPATRIRAIAELPGIPDRGEQLAAVVEDEIAAVKPLLPDDPAAPPLRVAMLYLRGERTQLIFGEGTSIDWLIEATGSVNVATEIGVVGPANITAEALIAAAPDVLLVTTDGLASVGGIDGLLSMPAIAGTPAATHRAVLAYDAQLMLGNGPRTGKFLAQLVADLGDLVTRLAAEQADHTKENL